MSSKISPVEIAPVGNTTSVPSPVASVVKVIAVVAVLPITTEVALTLPTERAPAEPTSIPVVALGLTRVLTNVATPGLVIPHCASAKARELAAPPIVMTFTREASSPM